MHAVTQSAPQRADAPLPPAAIDERDADIVLALNLPLFEQLGCASAAKKVGLVQNSVQFHPSEHEASQTFAFADAWEGVPKYAYQVRRSEFDHALLQHARTRGVEVVESDVYDSEPVRRRVMMFRGIYYLSSIKHWRQAWRSVVNRSNAIRPQAICTTDGSG